MCESAVTPGKAIVTILEGRPVKKRTHYKVNFKTNRAWLTKEKTYTRMLGSEKV
jgi:hypothetical protein